MRDRFDGMGPGTAARYARIALVLVALSASCSERGIVRSGHALSPTARVTFGGAVAFPPGTKMGFLLAFLHNVSDEPIQLVKIELTGRGLGRNVRVVKVEVSPNLGGIRAIPGGGYVTDPPVNMLEDGRCHSPLLRPVAGFTLQPGAEARAWVVLEWDEPGTFLLGPHEISYLRDGVLERQIVELFYRGVVDPAAKPPRIEPFEQPCLSRTTLLNPPAA